MAVRWLLAVCLIVGLSGCATAPRKPPPASLDVSLSSLCQKYALDCQWDGIAQTVRMSYHGTKIQALVGSSVVVIGNAQVSLSAPLYRKKGAVMVPADFESTVIGSGEAPPGGALLGSRPLGKVVIDAGHGGKDPGAIGYSHAKEKSITLDVARRVRDELRKAGIDVVMTRDKDEFITLEDRTEIASQPGVELFVSIHANAHKSRRARGVEVYYLGALNPNDHQEDQRLINEKKLCGKLQMKKGSDDVKKIVLSLLSQNKFSLSPGLADRLARDLASGSDERSRGSKPQRYFVLRNTLIPAVLIEVGFVSNPKEEQQLKDSAYQQKIAETITQSILEYLYASGV